MKITYTFLGDGTSDACLLNAIRWILDLKEIAYVEQNATHSLPTNKGLRQRINAAIDLYPCDMLFVHRDAENQTYNSRLNEINSQIVDLMRPSVIPVIPIRMTEAWLLIEEPAIRKAVGNPNGTMPLNLPAIRNLEGLPNPKELLFEKLKIASGLGTRRLTKFQPQRYRHRVADLISTYEPLRSIDSFLKLETRINQAIDEMQH